MRLEGSGFSPSDDSNSAVRSDKLKSSASSAFSSVSVRFALSTNSSADGACEISWASDAPGLCSVVRWFSSAFNVSPSQSGRINIGKRNRVTGATWI